MHQFNHPSVAQLMLMRSWYALDVVPMYGDGNGTNPCVLGHRVLVDVIYCGAKYGKPGCVPRSKPLLFPLHACSIKVSREVAK
jgi:hypothetical protein